MAVFVSNSLNYKKVQLQIINHYWSLNVYGKADNLCLIPQPCIFSLFSDVIRALIQIDTILRND